MKQSNLSFFAALMSVLFISAQAFAAVSVNPDFQGTLVITTPDGEISLLEPGDPMPEIRSGSMLEVFDGQFDAATQTGDQLEISCLEHDAVVGQGAAFTLRCGEETGLLKVNAGNMDLITPQGEQIELNTGDEYEIRLEAALLGAAPATAAGQDMGRTRPDAAPDIDPTSIAETARDLRERPASPLV